MLERKPCIDWYGQPNSRGDVDNGDEEWGRGKNQRKTLCFSHRDVSLPASVHALYLIFRKIAAAQNVGFTQTLCETLGVPQSSLLGLQICIMVPSDVQEKGSLPSSVA